MSTQLSTATDLLRGVKDATLLLETALPPDAFRATVQPGSVLRLEGAISSGKVVLANTKVRILDQSNNPAALSFACGIVTLNLLELWQNDESSPAFDVVAKGHFLFFPVWRHIVSLIPVDVQQLATWAETTIENQPTPEKPSNPSDKPVPPTEKPADGGEKPVVPAEKPTKGDGKPHAQPPQPRDFRFDATFNLQPGAKLDLNDGTTVTVADDGTAAVTITGVRDFAVATVTGTNIVLDTSMLTTGPSDLDVQVTLNRRPGGAHVIALDKCTLRHVQFKPTGFTPPTIDVLRIKAGTGKDGAKTYDFVITVDPHNDFTLDDLIAKITAKVKDPNVIAKLKAKLAEKAGAVGNGGPTVIELDSDRWNIVDYATHELKGQFAAVLELPHIRLDMQDPAVRALSRDAVPHLRLFVSATQLQIVSQHDAPNLVQMARLALSPELRAALDDADPAVIPDLLRVLGHTAEEAQAFVQHSAPGMGRVDKFLASAAAGDSELAARIARVLVRAGNILNDRQRDILRTFWIDVGGMERSGRAYVLLANLVEALNTAISNDPDAPAALKYMLQQHVPTGEALHRKIAVAADNLRGAVWASQNVVPDGWGAVSKRLESEIERLFGDPKMPGINVPRRGSSVFREQAARAGPGGDAFFDAHVRFIANGEEFLQQIIKLLDDTAEAELHSDSKSTIVLNYWSFEAYHDPKTGKPNVWGLKIAEKLKSLAMDGFTVSIVVDEKNGPSRRGQEGLSAMADEVRAQGKGRFELHPWLPSEERFPLGTHVKYLVTPIGVIAGGSNLGDHYLHWTDTNILLSGREVVHTFAAHHDAILREQRAVGFDIPHVCTVEAGDPAAWAPLESYVHHKEEVVVFHPQWDNAGIRVFRDQGGDEHDRILVEHIAALDAARGADGVLPPQTVYIANCYFALPQPMDEHPIARALIRALKRGVNVELLTNTVDSIDVPVVAGPVLKSVFLMMKRARAIAKVAAEQGGVAGTLTVHLPSGDYIARVDKVPEVLIHDKLLFFENLALVATHNLHPRSFTMEQELLTEIIGATRPERGEAHEVFIGRARRHFEEMIRKPGGDRVGAVDDIMAPLEWQGDSPPALWGPAAQSYVLFQEKKWLYCHSYSSRTDEEVTKVEGMLDVTSKASLMDLIINAF